MSNIRLISFYTCFQKLILKKMFDIRVFKKNQFRSRDPIEIQEYFHIIQIAQMEITPYAYVKNHNFRFKKTRSRDHLMQVSYYSVSDMSRSRIFFSGKEKKQRKKKTDTKQKQSKKSWATGARSWNQRTSEGPASVPEVSLPEVRNTGL